MKEIIRSYLEIKSIKDLIESEKPQKNLEIKKINPPDFELNKFLYKQVGKKYYWVDRLAWSNNDWANYVNRKDLCTYVLKAENEISGFFELIYHKNTLEVEIAYLGLLDEFIGKKLGGYLLSEAIKISWNFNIRRVWVHTCSLDHKNALNNYFARGMKMYNNTVAKIKC